MAGAPICRRLHLSETGDSRRHRGLATPGKHQTTQWLLWKALQYAIHDWRISRPVSERWHRLQVLECRSDACLWQCIEASCTTPETAAGSGHQCRSLGGRSIAWLVRLTAAETSTEVDLTGRTATPIALGRIVFLRGIPLPSRKTVDSVRPARSQLLDMRPP